MKKIISIQSVKVARKNKKIALVRRFEMSSMLTHKHSHFSMNKAIKGGG